MPPHYYWLHPAICTHIQVILSQPFHVVITFPETIVHNIVRSFTVQSYLSVPLQNDGHPFSNVIEVQNAEKLVNLLLSENLREKSVRN